MSNLGPQLLPPGERRSRLPTRPFLLAAAVLAALVFLRQGYCLNLWSESMPRGLYSLHPPGQSQPHLAYFCLPPDTAAFGRDRGYLGLGPCPRHTAALIKPVVAWAGDSVRITEQGVTVNGRLLPCSAPLPMDRAGRPLTSPAPTRFTVPTGHFLALSSHTPTSWDGRYWGALPTNRIRANAEPLLVEPMGCSTAIASPPTRSALP